MDSDVDAELEFGGTTHNGPPDFPDLAGRTSCPGSRGGADTQRVYDALGFCENRQQPDSFCRKPRSVYGAVAKLGSDSVRQIRIVHIGDSHLQADVFSGKLRSLFQQKFGSAGRGLIFPYRLAGTNGPRDYTCSSNVYWQSLKSIYAGEGPSLGLSGLGIRSGNGAPALYLQMKQKEAAQYAFDKVTIFCKDTSGDWNIGLPEGGVLAPKSVQYETGAKRYHKVRSGDTLYDLARKYGCTVRNLQAWNGIRGSRINPGKRLIVGVTRKAIPAPAVEKTPLRPLESVRQESGAHHVVFQLDSLLTSAAIEHQGSTLLHGILLENTRESGILYNMIGVNGATYNHYNQAAYFLPQLAALSPDLVIISLGTNESVGGRFDGERYPPGRGAFGAQYSKGIARYGHFVNHQSGYIEAPPLPQCQ